MDATTIAIFPCMKSLDNLDTKSKIELGIE